MCVCCVCVCVCVYTPDKMAIHLQCLACATLQGMYSLEGSFLVSMCAAVLLSLQMVQSGQGWEVLWCLLRGDFLYSWSYPEEVEQSKVGPACDVQYDGVTTITAATRTCACDCSVSCVLCVCVCACVCVLCVCIVCCVCVCAVCVCALLIQWLYICNVLHVPCCRVEQSADFRFEMLSCTIW